MNKITLKYKINKQGEVKLKIITKKKEMRGKVYKRRGRHPNNPVREFRGNGGKWIN